MPYVPAMDDSTPFRGEAERDYDTPKEVYDEADGEG
jgi:hypothetical protein